MKRFMGISLTALMALSVTACTRSTAYKDNLYGSNTGYNNNQYNQGQITGRQVGYDENSSKSYTATYKDGIYTARGNATAYGNEVATVEVRGGRITHVVLDREDTSGKLIGYDGRTGNTIVDTNPRFIAAGGKEYANNYNTYINDWQGKRVEYQNNTGRAVGMETKVHKGTPTGAPSGAPTGGPTSINGRTAGLVSPSLVETRTNLVNSIIKNQSQNVSTEYMGNSDVVNNWKLAVQRALDKARL